MDYVQTGYQQFAHHPTYMTSQGTSYGGHQHLMHGYSMSQTSQQQSGMIAMPHGTRTNETKPRLGKEEVEILEREFDRNPKPTTQIKRQYAEQMNVDLPRINNWFQNRRAKSKQEKKIKLQEGNQNAQDAVGLSEPPSPEYYQNNYPIDNQNQMLSMQSTSGAYQTIAPPQAMASYNPQYTDTTAASLESLQRTMQSAAQAQTHQFSQGLPYGGSSLTLHDSSIDHARFPNSESLNHFDSNLFEGFPGTFDEGIFPSVQQVTSSDVHNPAPFNSFSHPETTGTMGPFPSELIQANPHSFTDVLAIRPHESNGNQSLEHNEATPVLGFQESPASYNSPPPASSLFKDPPPPTNLASRRKVHTKPAALGAETMRSRPAMGPRTVSNADNLRRLPASPLPESMRRIVSAGGNRNVISGRVQKSGIESAQRSPMNLGSFDNFETLMEQSNNVRAPSLTASSSLNSSLAPPTPMSPRETKMSLGKRENSISSNEDGLFGYMPGNGGYATLSPQVTDQTPPETPQAHLTLHSTPDGWPANVQQQNDHPTWSLFGVSDEPQFTPVHDAFDAQLTQPQYSSSISQPVTPAFGQFNQGLFGNGSPQFGSASPLYPLQNQQEPDFSFSSIHANYPIGMVGSSPTMTTKQKQFQFSNTTAADFSEK